MDGTESAVELRASEAACLDAIREGHCTNTRIAVETGRDLRTVAATLERLRHARLIAREQRSGPWRATGRGRRCGVRIVPDPQRRRGRKASGRIVPGSAADRLLEALARPMRGAELVERLGISPQGLRQIVVKLHGQGRVRLGDRAHLLHLVARAEDTSVLLTRDEERILSALPNDAATTATKLAAVTHIPVAAAEGLLARLRDAGLVENAGNCRDRAAYRLSRGGRAHFQRRAEVRRAQPAPLPVRSDRVRNVLSHIAGRGEARIRDVRDALGIPQASANALMQYLKRKRLVRKVSHELSAPYALTDQGGETLARLNRTMA